MSPRTIIRTGAVLALVASVSLIGCKEKPSPTASGTGSNSGDGASYRIGVIAKSDGNPVFQAARQGAKDAAAKLSEELGVRVDIDWRTPKREEAQEQAQNLEALAAGGVAGIAISCSDANVLTGSINDAVAGGVEVVCFDSDAPDSDRFAYFGVDDTEAGREVMRQLVKVIGENGIVAVLAGNQAAPNLQARVRGVREIAEQYPGITIRDVYYHEETADQAAQKMKQVQTNNPDITGWALVGGWPLYTENALDGIYETAKIVSMDTLRPALAYVKKGQVQVLVGQPYYGWGYESVRLLVDKLHAGKDPASEFIYADFDIVTPENVEEFEQNWDKWLPSN